MGRTGRKVGAIGVCPGSEAVARRARDRGCTLVGPEFALGDAGLVRYNLLDQKDANREIARLSREGRGIVATHVLAGGALAGPAAHAPLGARITQLRCLVRPGRTLVQAAVQFVLANESVSAAIIRCSSLDHLDEILDAPRAEPLSGQDLEQIFELWANRFE
ncbi:MAG TPA: aldo/keto reductase [Planctomycetota bacterium]|jgi:aryl-alcohol dehydrogenase-like predicted oxidoreductase|nr:aldo/keto reductase [Planctomycetota bacterium]